MAGLSSQNEKRLQQLSALYRRGRSLSYQNVVTLTGATHKLSPLSNLVYVAAQMVYGFSLMEAKRYLDDDVHDAFTDRFFQTQSNDVDRLLALFQRYGAAAGTNQMGPLFLEDLAASIGGRGRDDVISLLRGVPITLQKLTLLHTAQVFGDAKTLREYS